MHQGKQNISCLKPSNIVVCICHIQRTQDRINLVRISLFEFHLNFDIKSIGYNKVTELSPSKSDSQICKCGLFLPHCQCRKAYDLICLPIAIGYYTSSFGKLYFSLLQLDQLHVILAVLFIPPSSD